MTTDQLSKSKEKIRARFAPSPTGFFHIGSARTALFNYLFAKKYQGSFILRIEDTDKERSKEIYKQDILKNLKWLNIQYDEIYVQSNRKEIYEKYIEQLLSSGHCYRCFCSEDEIKAIRQDQLSRGEAPHYIGQCYNLELEKLKTYLKQKKPYTIRLKVGERKVVFKDMIRGKIEFDMFSTGDFIVAKTSSAPLYNLAVVIDDYEMGISHVIRGEDHVSNTPRQILIQKALNFPQPYYAHLPLLLGHNRAKLSKRDCQIKLSEYRKEGYYPEALINFIALLGWNPGTNQELFSLDDLIKHFSLEKIQKGGAICNTIKLDWFNKHYLRQKSNEQLIKDCLVHLLNNNVIEKTNGNKFKIVATSEEINSHYLEKVVLSSRERLKKVSEIVKITEVYFNPLPVYDKNLLLWQGATEIETLKVLYKLENVLTKISIDNWTLDHIKKVLFSLADEIGDKGKIFYPLRVALSGREVSPPPFDMVYIFEITKTKERIRKAIAVIEREKKEKKRFWEVIKMKLGFSSTSHNVY